MNLNEQIQPILKKIKVYSQNILNEWEYGTDMTLFAQEAYELSEVMTSIGRVVPQEIYTEYYEFFNQFRVFCGQCKDIGFMQSHIEDMVSSLSLVIECIDDLSSKCSRRIRKCVCCGRDVVCRPMSDRGQEDLICPVCGAGDRERMVITFLKKEKLRDAAEETRVLQIAPVAVVGQWITQYCPQTEYEIADLFREETTLHSDLQRMHGIADGAYDVIICSDVVRDVWDDRQVQGELKRILKPHGIILFGLLVELDEKLTGRLEEQFCIHSLLEEYFGKQLYEQCALTDTSVLYALTKEAGGSLNLEEKVTVDEMLCREGPLVSVIMSCYNHEPFVAAAIESVINQSYKNIEFIVADDASSDHTANIMKKYSSHYAKEIYFEENYGGRSEYLQQFATGKYIALMHSDDVWEKDKLALQVAYMEQHEECGACLTWCMYTDENLEEMEETTFLKMNRSSSQWMNYFWKHGNVLCNPSSLTRRETAVNVRKNPCSQLPDFFKWVDIVQHSSIYIVPKVLIRMRRYSREGRVNTSAYTDENHMRSLIETGANWLYVIRDMESSFFRQAFGEMMIHPEADTEEEIKCEKFFLMLNHSNVFIQHSAMCYFSEIFDEVKECMEEKYHYSYKELRRDSMEKGIAPFLYKEQEEEQE